MMEMDTHTLEDTNKVGGMEKESSSGQMEAKILQNMLIHILKKEQPSTMIKIELNKTDFTKMAI